MFGRGCFSRRLCSSPVNCGVGINSSSSLYSGTGGRGTIGRDAVSYSQEPLAATNESQHFPHYDSSPIEFTEASQHQADINESDYVKNPQSLQINDVEVERVYQEQEVNPMSMEQQIPQPMYSPVTTEQAYESTFPVTNSFEQAHDSHNAQEIYPVMTKSQPLFDQEYQDAIPKTISASSWSVTNKPNGRNEVDLYMNSAAVEELQGSRNAVSVGPRGFSVDELIPSQHSQHINFNDSSAISFDVSITQPAKLQKPQVASWNTNAGSYSLNDQWTSQQGYQQSSHLADAFTNPVSANSGFNTAYHREIPQSYGFSENNMATGIDMAADAAMIAQRAGG